MLADPLHIGTQGGLGGVLALVAGGDPAPRRLRRGVYEISHFSFNHCLPNTIGFPNEVGERFGWWLEYCELGEVTHESESFKMHEFNSYGVCDSPEQFFGHALGKWIEASEKYYVVSFTKITKASQPAQGGWRWHKWGPYIGVHEPECEYIYDEGDEIQEVYCYHVFECLSEDAIAPIEEEKTC